MNAQERRAALQNIFKLSGYYNSISGVLGIDQWGGLPEEGVDYRLQGRRMRPVSMGQEPQSNCH